MKRSSSIANLRANLIGIIVISLSCSLPDGTWAGQVSQEQVPDKDAPTVPDYGSALDRIRQVIQAELQRGIVTGVSVAMIDDQQVIMADGFGLADKEQEIPATAQTVYRAGSISKLFTALATMQLVSQGRIDIDAPITRYLPEFRIVIPFENASAITLRQLMCHRSGLVRESPVGGYLDDSQASISQSVASLRSCVLVNPPNRITRYSNIGATVVGQAVATVSEQSFAEYQQQFLLGPLGMTRSGWSADGPIREKLAIGYMRVADGCGGFHHRSAPSFELGTVPAGNLYSNVNDMTRFARMVLAGGQTPRGRVISEEILSQMATPQLTDGETGFGIGFFVDRFAGYRSMQHTGAVYGFSTSIVILPEAAIAVVVLANEDIASGPVRRISNAALELMLEAKIGKKPLLPPPTIDLTEQELAAFVGQYESSAHWADVKLEGNQLTVDIAGQPNTLRPIGLLKFEADGRQSHHSAVTFKQDDSQQVIGFSARGQSFTRVSKESVPIPDAWQKYAGSYGPAFIPLVISVHHGHLYAMTENMVDYRLTPLNQTVFKMPAGLYADEQLVFQLDENHRVHGVCLANMELPRRHELTDQP